MNVTKTVVTGLAALTAVAALGACGNSATKEATSSSASTSASAIAESPHNQADVMFAQMMIPHHQQAIEMSDTILGKQGIDARVVDLATQIKAAQGPEIAKMQGWLTDWGMGGMTGMPGMDHGNMGGMDHGNMGAMDGMMSPAEMDALKNAQGIAASKLFLTGMIKHHQGAITMSQTEVKDGQNADAVALAKSIVESQQKEIDTMNQILGSL